MDGKKVAKRVGGFCGSVTDRVVCIIMALLLSQAPTYISQYRDVLGGALTEATKVYKDLETRAAGHDMDVRAFVDYVRSSRDPIFADSGEVHYASLQRYDEYRAAYAAFNDASLVSKPMVLARHYDADLGARVKEGFEPNVPLTGEAIVYALVGVLLAIGGLAGGKWLTKESYVAVKQAGSKEPPRQIT